MMRKKVFLTKIVKRMLVLSIMGFLFHTSFVWAADDLFTSAYNTLHDTFVEARKVVYVLSGFGLVGFAVAAIFNKISFRWLAMIAIALFTLAIADKIIDTATNPDSIKVTSSFSVNTEGFNIKTSADNFNLKL